MEDFSGLPSYGGDNDDGKTGYAFVVTSCTKLR